MHKINDENDYEIGDIIWPDDNDLSLFRVLGPNEMEPLWSDGTATWPIEGGAWTSYNLGSVKDLNKFIAAHLYKQLRADYLP